MHPYLLDTYLHSISRIFCISSLLYPLKSASLPARVYFDAHALTVQMTGAQSHVIPYFTSSAWRRRKDHWSVKIARICPVGIEQIDWPRIDHCKSAPPNRTLDTYVESGLFPVDTRLYLSMALDLGVLYT